MKASLGAFARTEIEAAVGPDLGEGVERAVAHYRRRIGEGDPPPGPPRFLAAARGPESERMTTHAVMVYLADLE